MLTSGGRVLAGYTAVNDGNGTGDCHGHGTRVAGTVGGTAYGGAKQVSLARADARVRRSGTSSSVITGLDWVVAQHAAGTPAVLNMSLGVDASMALDLAVQATVGDGIAVDVAAGNAGEDACNFSPTRAPAALTVGASTRTRRAGGVQQLRHMPGPGRPGAGISSTCPSSTTATATLSGTSMA